MLENFWFSEVFRGRETEIGVKYVKKVFSFKSFWNILNEMTVWNNSFGLR